MCIGDVMLDVHAASGALAAGGDVHGRVVVQPGGTSANAAVWGAWAGASSTVIGAIGDDAAGRVVRESLEGRDVRAGVVVVPGATTGTMLVVFEAGDRSMVADRGANARLLPSDLPGELDPDALLVSGYLLLQEPTTETALEALRRSRARLSAVDAASWPLVEGFGLDRFRRETSGVTALLANEREAELLTGLTGEDACRELGERHPVAAVKLGAAGAALCVDGASFLEPSPAVTEVDPTGAGDAFDGVLLTALARGDDPREALRLACRAGSIVAGREDTWPPANASSDAPTNAATSS